MKRLADRRYLYARTSKYLRQKNKKPSISGGESDANSSLPQQNQRSSLIIKQQQQPPLSTIHAKSSLSTKTTSSQMSSNQSYQMSTMDRHLESQSRWHSLFSTVISKSFEVSKERIKEQVTIFTLCYILRIKKKSFITGFETVSNRDFLIKESEILILI
jgi:hypothetical protein